MVFGELRSLVQSCRQDPLVMDQILWLLFHARDQSVMMRAYVLDHLEGYAIGHVEMCDLVAWVLDGAPYLVAYCREHFTFGRSPDADVWCFLCGWSWAVIRDAIAIEEDPHYSSNPNGLILFEGEQILYMHQDIQTAGVSCGFGKLSISGFIHVWVDYADEAEDRDMWPGLPERLRGITTEHLHHDLE